jgi:hypothetical protein
MHPWESAEVRANNDYITAVRLEPDTTTVVRVPAAI